MLVQTEILSKTLHLHTGGQNLNLKREEGLKIFDSNFERNNFFLLNVVLVN